MNDQIVALKKKVDWLERKVGDLEKNHATVAKYFQALETQREQAVLALVGHRSKPQPAELHKIRKLLGVT